MRAAWKSPTTAATGTPLDREAQRLDYRTDRRLDTDELEPCMFPEVQERARDIQLRPAVAVSVLHA